ncbi:hypothetical protein 3 [Hubei dimarhabdovirus virus 2]|uniref:hypothetical protein 3 n=1 Tax=Hubei dimarhabdovirus virus 2 TaxID=1922867 RepID=UPI00090B308D|nr:hypothetical protein 3 [Hubei dimarhabdovirus virus 2]APG78721.1 hypothetical protein 3 [Hubei dimarhabdovirus virus 2]
MNRLFKSPRKRKDTKSSSSSDSSSGSLSELPISVWIPPTSTGPVMEDYWIRPTSPPVSIVFDSHIVRYVKLNLAITSNKPIKNHDEMINMLSLIIDHYQGPIVLKPVILALYGAAGMSLKLDRGMRSDYKYLSRLDQILMFHTKNRDYSEEICDINWIKTSSLGGNRYSIQYSLTMEKSNRKGNDFFSHYRKYSRTEKSMSMEVIKEILNIDRMELESDTAVFL